MAERWAELYASGRTPWDSEAPASQLVDYLKRRRVEGLRAVELCCGTGASAVHLAKCGCQLVVGVDIAPEAIAIAERRAREAGVEKRCIFLVADASAEVARVIFEAVAKHEAAMEAEREREKERHRRSLTGQLESCLADSAMDDAAALDAAALAGKQRAAAAASSVAAARPSENTTTGASAMGDDDDDDDDDNPARGGQNGGDSSGDAVVGDADAAALAGLQFDFCFDCQGFQLLWTLDVAATAMAALLKPRAKFLVVAGNANEPRTYEGGDASLTCAELVAALSAPFFSLRSISETRFDQPMRAYAVAATQSSRGIFDDDDDDDDDDDAAAAAAGLILASSSGEDAKDATGSHRAEAEKMTDAGNQNLRGDGGTRHHTDSRNNKEEEPPPLAWCAVFERGDAPFVSARQLARCSSAASMDMGSPSEPCSPLLSSAAAPPMMMMMMLMPTTTTTTTTLGSRMEGGRPPLSLGAGLHDNRGARKKKAPMASSSSLRPTSSNSNNNNNNNNNNKTRTSYYLSRSLSMSSPASMFSRSATGDAAQPSLEDHHHHHHHQQQQQQYNFDDAVDAALSVDGSVAPSECGSDATSAFAGSDGFENISASRAAAARAEQARLEGDVPWIRWWDKHANTYEAFTEAQPLVRAVADSVASTALAWAFSPETGVVDASRVRNRGSDEDARRGASSQEEGRASSPTGGATTRTRRTPGGGGEKHDRRPPIVHVDLAAGSGLCAAALAGRLRRAPHRRSLRSELVEPAHRMAALARARAARTRFGRDGAATVWQIPVERSSERLPSRLLGTVDVVTCASAMACLNEHDVFEVAAALLRPGGALAFDLWWESYAPTDHLDYADSWAPGVEEALRSRGLLDKFDLPKKPPLLRKKKMKPGQPPLNGATTTVHSNNSDAPEEEKHQEEDEEEEEEHQEDEPTPGVDKKAPPSSSSSSFSRDTAPAVGATATKKGDAVPPAPKRPVLDVKKVKSRPPIRAPCSASSIAAAAAAAGLRLASCTVEKHVVGGDFFVAYRAMSSTWLHEPFEKMPRADAKTLRSHILVDAARRAARHHAVVDVAILCVVKPASSGFPGSFFHNRLGNLGAHDPSDPNDNGDLAGARPIVVLNDDHFSGR